MRTPRSDAIVIAHQGGWDEALLIVAPLLVVGLLLWATNKWAVKRARDD